LHSHCAAEFSARFFRHPKNLISSVRLLSLHTCVDALLMRFRRGP